MSNLLEKTPSAMLSFKEVERLINILVRDDYKLPGDSGEVPIFEWSGWQFDFHCEVFSLLDIKKLAK
jgi:hypothetical protein